MRQMRAAVLILSVFMAVLVGAVVLHTADGQPTPAAQTQKQTSVLFLCPHGAAKSVLASAYFQKAAKERGLNVRVESAGTEPDAEVSPTVAAHLRKSGYPVPVDKPRAVTGQDLDAADLVISMGCDLKGLPVRSGTLRTWDDVPGPGQNFQAADDAIRRRVMELLDELVAHERKSR